MSRTNTGKPFEKLLEKTFAAYQALGVMSIEHVDPPTRSVRCGGQWKVIWQPNPFVDYLGTWTARGGRMLCLEAKSTDQDVLDINSYKSNGVTIKQWESIKRWSNAGAACGILWQCPAGIRLVSVGTASDLVARGERCRVENSWAIPQGKGWLLADFAPILAQIIYG
jgi:hypothetical protein